MSTAKERVARALYAREKERADHCDSVLRAAGGNPRDTMEPWDECREMYLGDADAVLSVLAEPDEGMVSAGMHKLSELPEDAGWPTLARGARDIFSAMIAKAREG